MIEASIRSAARLLTIQAAGRALDFHSASRLSTWVEGARRSVPRELRVHVTCGTGRFLCVGLITVEWWLEWIEERGC